MNEDIKETVSVNSRTGFTTVPLNALSDTIFIIYDNFQILFLYKSDLRLSTAGQLFGIIRI